MKRNKEEGTGSDKSVKKFSVITALLSAGALTAVLITGAYVYIKSWTPITEVFAEKHSGDTLLDVSFTTTLPVKGYVLYGTNTIYTNRKDFEGTIINKAQVQIAHILPGKEHFIKIVATSEDGRVFETDFIRVK